MRNQMISSKLETRNPKQNLFETLRFRISDLFRISNLGFRIFIIISSIFSFTNISCAQGQGPGVGDKAPDFILPDLAGNRVRLQEVVSANQATLLVFGATWCPYCREEVPKLKQLHASNAKKGLKILSVDIGESKKKIGAFVNEQGITYTVLLDEDNDVAGKYEIRGIPANLLIGKDGIIKYRGTGLPPKNLLP